MSKLAALLHSEIVSLYVGLNIILLNLHVLGVTWLTDVRIKAIIAIADVAVGAVVRALVTPTAVRQIPPTARPPLEV